MWSEPLPANASSVSSLCSLNYWNFGSLNKWRSHLWTFACSQCDRMPAYHVVTLSPRCPIACIGLGCTLVFSLRAARVFSATNALPHLRRLSLWLQHGTLSGCMENQSEGEYGCTLNTSWKQFQNLEVLWNHSGKLTSSPLKMKW